MKPVNTALIVGTITTLGRWARGESLTITTVVGVVGIAVMLSVIDQFSSSLARAFGVLILVSTAAVFVPDIVKKSGL